MSMDNHEPRQLSSVRVAPLPPEDRDQRTKELLERLRWSDGRELNVFTTLAHRPRAPEALVRFCWHVDDRKVAASSARAHDTSNGLALRLSIRVESAHRNG